MKKLLLPFALLLSTGAALANPVIGPMPIIPHIMQPVMAVPMHVPMLSTYRALRAFIINKTIIR